MQGSQAHTPLRRDRHGVDGARRRPRSPSSSGSSLRARAPLRPRPRARLSPLVSRLDEQSTLPKARTRRWHRKSHTPQTRTRTQTPPPCTLPSATSQLRPSASPCCGPRTRRRARCALPQSHSHLHPPLLALRGPRRSSSRPSCPRLTRPKQGQVACPWMPRTQPAAPVKHTNTISRRGGRTWQQVRTTSFPSMPA